jgi:hypothetical protein
MQPVAGIGRFGRERTLHDKAPGQKGVRNGD